MSEAIISVRNLGLCYNAKKQVFKKAAHKKGFWALKDVSFDVYRGEKLGVIGRNGCGKSTLMKVLAGVIGQDKGTLDIQRNLHVQLLSLGVGLEGHLSGRENAILNGMLLGKSRGYMLECVERICDFSELGDFFDAPVNTYSSGMIARLGFSVAMEVEPDVLLLDELLGVGDASFAEKSTQAMQEKFSSNRTVVLISHDPHTISRLCDRAVWMDGGKTIMTGPTAEISEKYLASL